MTERYKLNAANHTEWCHRHFTLMNHGGLWLVPRTGIIFRKTANALLWIAVVPAATHYRVVPPKLIDEMRELDFEQHVAEFDKAGVPMMKASVIQRFDSFDAARAFYGKLDDSKLVNIQ